MSQFLRTLRSFREGALSNRKLLSEIDRQLTARAEDAVTMLAQLDDEHARESLPEPIREAVASRILRSLEVTAAPRSLSATVAEDATLRLADHDNPVSLLAGVAPDTGTQKNAELPADGSLLKHRFKLVSCVGEGGMGRVFKAIDLRRVESHQEDVHVAVKVLTRSFRDYSGSLAALQSEATKLQRLTHPNIVRVIDVDRDGQTVFMTMEYLPGQPLKRMLQSASATGLDRATALSMLERIAAALSFAHHHDIVHGDLKPSNIIVADDGDVKVIDFGIARMITRSARNGRARSMPAGSETLSGLTPSYASPEMLDRQDHPADPRDDVYALACIVHEMLTGRHPFERATAAAARDSGATLRRHKRLTGREYRALTNALRFDGSARTPTVERFMQDLRGDKLVSVPRIVAYGAVVALVLAVGAYFLVRARSAPSVSPPVAGDVFRDCNVCPLMKVVPSGHFEQGSTADDPDAQPFELPRHAVTIPHALALGEYEVTRAQYSSFVEETQRQTTGGCSTYDGEWSQHADRDWTRVGFQQTASHPVACVSWEDATAYTAWLSKKTGKRYRLPSASEWEYSAGSGSGVSRPWRAQTNEACTAANVADESASERFPGWNVHTCNDGYVFTAPVGAFAANGFGLNDMLGNVFEWVDDCWHDTYDGAPADGSAWVDRGCKEREMRGGSWFTTPAFVRAGYRNRFEPAYRSSSVGFRVVRDMD